MLKIQCYNATVYQRVFGMVDWSLAARIAGLGFSIVFIVLGILCLVLWLINLLLIKVVFKKRKIESREE
jgi:Na+-transporting methylmalonyl-CoA/oxaloacetate decarboxylase gamma subunit